MLVKSLLSIDKVQIYSEKATKIPNFVASPPYLNFNILTWKMLDRIWSHFVLYKIFIKFRIFRLFERRKKNRTKHQVSKADFWTKVQIFTCLAATALVRSVTMRPRSLSWTAKQINSWNLSSLPNLEQVVSILVISRVYILKYEKLVKYQY